jgi:hypothetical protein
MNKRVLFVPRTYHLPPTLFSSLFFNNKVGRQTVPHGCEPRTRTFPKLHSSRSHCSRKIKGRIMEHVKPVVADGTQYRLSSRRPRRHSFAMPARGGGGAGFPYGCCHGRQLWLNLRPKRKVTPYNRRHLCS